MAVKFTKDKENATKDVVAALQTEGADVGQAFADFGEAYAQEAAEKVMAKWEEAHGDQAALQARGFRTLTQNETEFYDKVAQIMRSPAPKQAFANLLGNDNAEDIMPTTIIEDVFAHLTEDHPLLAAVSTTNVKYFTKWILNAHNAQMAAWGAITAEITKEITSDLKVVSLHQNKLSCFVILEKGYADLGPVFLDAYIRQVMTDSMANALEAAIVSGTGADQPIGMDRDLSNESNGTYAQKTAIAVTEFTPAAYGELLANFAKYEDGKTRTFTSVTLIVNPIDYVQKIMPATTILNANAQYAKNVFPFPTDVIECAQVEEGTALIGLMDEYKLFVGQAARNEQIEYTDEYRFLEDQRVFKTVQYADGRAYDNTSFQLLDISGLEAAYLTVKEVGSAADATEDETVA